MHARRAVLSSAFDCGENAWRRRKKKSENSRNNKGQRVRVKLSMKQRCKSDDRHEIADRLFHTHHYKEGLRGTLIRITHHMHINLLTFGFAHSHAFNPCVIEFGVDFISALPDPTASMTATTSLASLRGAAFGTNKLHRAGNRRCSWDANMICKGVLFVFRRLHMCACV